MQANVITINMMNKTTPPVTLTATITFGPCSVGVVDGVSTKSIAKPALL